MLKALTANLGTKLISLFFALFLWLVVTAQLEESQSFRVPLALSGIPDSLTIIHEVPEHIEVTIKGPRFNFIKLRLFSRLRASIDLSLAKRGRMNIPLSSAILNLTENIDPRDVTIDNPKTLNLNFERVMTKSVPVKVAFKGEIPRDIIITGKPVLIPEKVIIRGAASIVSGITLLNTEEIDIKNKKGMITQEVGLQLGGRNISVETDKVLLEMEISRKAVRTLANIPPTLLQDDETLVVEYSPKAVSLTIEGPSTPRRPRDSASRSIPGPSPGTASASSSWTASVSCGSRSGRAGWRSPGSCSRTGSSGSSRAAR